MKFSPENTHPSIETASLRVLEHQLKKLKPCFDEFFYEVMAHKPDTIIFLDKGARMLGRPFKKYISKLSKIIKSDYSPDIIFWNNESYKNNSKKISELYESSEYVGKKIYFVDETLNYGSFAQTLKEFFDQKGVNGAYFAFSHTENTNLHEVQNKLNHNFHLYPVYIESTLEIKNLSEMIIDDSIDNNPTISESVSRYQTRDARDLLMKANDLIEDSLNGLSVENYLTQRMQALPDQKNG